MGSNRPGVATLPEDGNIFNFQNIFSGFLKYPTMENAATHNNSE
jgi:hypothetical protein